jgi:beta-phosphoglucomutase-like phosphatase (HAD superfamily)
MTRKFRVFDCDDTLFDSERLAFQACTAVVNGVLTQKDVRESDGSLKQFTPDQLKKRFVGHSFREIIISLSNEYPPFTLADDEVENLVARELIAVTAKLKAEVQKTDGIDRVLKAYAADEDVVLVVVSSSAMSRVVACLERGDLTGYFGERVFSAASMTPPSSKLAACLEAMSVLGATPNNSEAYEDSVSGVTAWVRAGVKVMGYVGALPVSQQTDRKEALLKAGAYAVISHWDELSLM